MENVLSQMNRSAGGRNRFGIYGGCAGVILGIFALTHWEKLSGPAAAAIFAGCIVLLIFGITGCIFDFAAVGAGEWKAEVKPPIMQPMIQPMIKTAIQPMIQPVPEIRHRRSSCFSASMS